MLDETSRRILTILQDEGRVSTAEIARRLDLAQSTVYERVRELERQGVIEAYAARLAPSMLGLDLVAFLHVRPARHGQAIETGRRVAALPRVLEVHHVAGEDGLLVKVRARDAVDLWNWMKEHLETIETVGTTRTSIVLETVKESSRLDLDPAGGEA